MLRRQSARSAGGPWRGWESYLTLDHGRCSTYSNASHAVRSSQLGLCNSCCLRANGYIGEVLNRFGSGVRSQRLGVSLACRMQTIPQSRNRSKKAANVRSIIFIKCENSAGNSRIITDCALKSHRPSHLIVYFLSLNFHVAPDLVPVSALEEEHICNPDDSYADNYINEKTHRRDSI
jgi:hypothetical protein